LKLCPEAFQAKKARVERRVVSCATALHMHGCICSAPPRLPCCASPRVARSFMPAAGRKNYCQLQSHKKNHRPG
jgi:hypothetical protein